MSIYLVQHGKSYSKEENPERSLTAEGKTEVEGIATKLQALNVSINTIYQSGKCRALQTAEIFQQHLNTSGGVKELPGINPMDDVKPVAKALNNYDNAMLIGHLPFMEKLVAYLINRDETKTVIKFQNGGVIKLDYNSETASWVITNTLLPHF